MFPVCLLYEQASVYLRENCGGLWRFFLVFGRPANNLLPLYPVGGSLFARVLTPPTAVAALLLNPTRKHCTSLLYDLDFGHKTLFRRTENSSDSVDDVSRPSKAG